MDIAQQQKSKFVKVFCSSQNNNNKAYSTCSSLNNLFNKENNLSEKPRKKIKETISEKEKDQGQIPISRIKFFNPLKIIKKSPQKCVSCDLLSEDTIKNGKAYSQINKEKLVSEKALRQPFNNLNKSPNLSPKSDNKDRLPVNKRKIYWKPTYIANCFLKTGEKDWIESNLEENSLISKSPCLMDLANESLALIFAHLTASDISRVAGVCQRLRSICQQHRSYLPMSNIDLLRVNYGKWHDILKCRALRCCSDFVTYECSREMLRKPEICRLLRFCCERKCFLNFCCRRQKVPLEEMLNNCAFETTIINVEILNGDMRQTLRLSTIVTQNLILDLSHHALTLNSLRRYLPAICSDLSTNRHIKKINFLFNSNVQTETIPENECFDAIANAKKKFFVFFIGV